MGQHLRFDSLRIKSLNTIRTTVFWVTIFWVENSHLVQKIVIWSVCVYDTFGSTSENFHCRQICLLHFLHSSLTFQGWFGFWNSDVSLCFALSTMFTSLCVSPQAAPPQQYAPRAHQKPTLVQQVWFCSIAILASSARAFLTCATSDSLIKMAMYSKTSQS